MSPSLCPYYSSGVANESLSLCPDYSRNPSGVANESLSCVLIIQGIQVA